MDGENLILKIQALYNQFTRAEKKVADYVIQNQRDVLFMSITDLADSCHVGDTSVYRFCRRLELQGYQEFKMKLSFCQNDQTRAKEQEMKGHEDGFGNTAQRVMQRHLSAIQETYQLLDEEQFEKTLSMMEKARQVYFFGIGDSLLTAEEARNKFLRLTNKVICVRDPHMQAMAASIASEEDLIVFISYSGATKDNIHVAGVAKKAGVRIACITRFQKSPLTGYSDAVLLCGSNEGPLEGGSMSARMSQLYIVDLLYQRYYEKNFEACKDANEKTSTAVVEKLY